MIVFFTMKQLTLKPEQIKLNENNPRYITDENFEKLKQSVTDFPEMRDVRPIVINMDNEILGGNMRYRAMIESGMTEIPVIQVDWPIEKQKEFIIKDNVSGGEWDWEKLANEWDTEKINIWGLEIPDWANPKNVDDVNQKNEWEGMPDFDLASDSSKLIIQFDTDTERDEFVKKYEIEISKKMNTAWSTWWPYREQDDTKSLKYDTE
jgi:hypothetical protein